MKAAIFVDGKELKINPFIQEFTANLVDAMAKSLKHSEGKQVEFLMKREDFTMFVDSKEVPLNLGHASHIVGSTLRGFLSTLYGAENASEVRFYCER